MSSWTVSPTDQPALRWLMQCIVSRFSAEPASDLVCLLPPQQEHCLHLSDKTQSPSPPFACKNIYLFYCCSTDNCYEKCTLSSWSIRAIGSRDIFWKNSQPWVNSSSTLWAFSGSNINIWGDSLPTTRKEYTGWRIVILATTTYCLNTVPL